MILGAALSGSVLVLSLWPPLSATKRGVAVIILSAILAFHFLLAAGLQLYFFRYTDHVVVVSGNNDGTSRGHLRAVDSLAFDKVTELQPLSFIREIEKNSPSGSTNVETTDPKTTRTLVHLSAAPLVTGIEGEKLTLVPERVAVTASYSVSKDAIGHSEIPKIITKSSYGDGSTIGV